MRQRKIAHDDVARMTSQPTGEGLRPLMMVSFALPSILQGFMHGPATNFIQGIYAKHVGLSLAAIGSAVLITRIFDAITDPAIGYLSDRSFARSGTRKPWIAIGTLITVTSLWFLYRPGSDVTIVYFTFWFMMAYLGWTVTEIPYRAWSVELTSAYERRTQLSSLLAMGTYGGTILFYLLPIASEAIGVTPDRQVNLSTLGNAAVIIAFAMPLVNLYTLWVVPDGRPVRDPAAGLSVRDAIADVLRNKPMLVFAGVFIFQGTATGMIQGVTYLYIENHLRLENSLAVLLVMTLPVAFLSIPFWGWACVRFQKHRAWSVALILSAFGYLAFIFIPAGGQGFFAIVAANLLVFFAASATWVAPPAIIGDIADYGRMRSGTDLSGAYFSVYTLLQKSMSGIGVAVSFYILAYFGFDAGSNVQTVAGTTGLLLAMSVAPAVLVACAAVLIWRFPIDREQHAEILAALDRRKA